MEDTRQQFELVHVLRHSFRPSDQLQASLEAFTIPGPTRPRFLIKSLSALALNSVEHGNYKYDLAIHQSINTFRVHQEPLYLEGDLAARRMADGALKILMATRNHKDLSNFIGETRKRLPESMLLDDLEDERFNVYVRIDKLRAVSTEDLIKPGVALLNQLRSESGRLFNIIPEDIPGREEERVVTHDFYE